MADAPAPAPTRRSPLRWLLRVALVIAVAVLGAGALWDLGYARQLHDLEALVLKETPVADLQRGDPTAIAAAAVSIESGLPERVAGMEQFERIHPPPWKERIHQQLLSSLRHWQELDRQVLFARLGDTVDDVMQKFIEPNLDEILLRGVELFGLVPEKGDPRQLARDYSRDILSQAFARLPDYQRAYTESELLYRRARRIYFLF